MAVTAQHVRSLIDLSAQNYEQQLDELLKDFMPKFIASNGCNVHITQQDCENFNIDLSEAKKLLLKRGFSVSTHNQFGIDLVDTLSVTVPPGAE